MGHKRRTTAGLLSLAALLVLAAIGGQLAAGVASLGLGAATGATVWRLHHAWLVRHPA